MSETKQSVKPVLLSEPFNSWKRADLHVHSWHSKDVMPTSDVSPLALYERALNLGMDFVTFTDHDTMNAYNEIGWSRDHLVTGVEVKLLDPVNIGHTLHINVYTLNLGQFHDIQTICSKSRKIDVLVEYLNAEDLPFAYNHPFWSEAGEQLNIRSVFDIAPLFPVLEYNKGRVARLNQQAVRLARNLGKGLTASTDTHSGHVGEAFTAAPGESFRDFFSSIIGGQSVMHHVDMTPSTFTWELRHRIHHLFHRHSWVFDKPEFSLDTGSDKLDQLIEKVIRSPRERLAPSLRVLGQAMDLIARTRFPAMIFIKNQQGLGKSIEAWLSNHAA